MSLFSGVGRVMRSGMERRRVALACLLSAAACLLAAGPAAAQGTVRNTYDDWQLRCETPAGAKASNAPSCSTWRRKTGPT